MNSISEIYRQLKTDVEAGNTHREGIINCGDGAYQIMSVAPRAEFDALADEISKEGSIPLRSFRLLEMIFCFSFCGYGIRYFSCKARSFPLGSSTILEVMRLCHIHVV